MKYVGSTGYQTVDPPPKREPQVGRGLFGIRLLILHFKFQFSKAIKSSTFHTFLNLTYPLRKNMSFPKCARKTSKNLHKTAKQWLMKINRKIKRRLKSDRDIGRKAVLTDVKKSLHVYPRLKQSAAMQYIISSSTRFMLLCKSLA